MKNTFLTAAMILVLAGSLSAQVPQLISYQGRIVVAGTNFDGTGQFKFALINGAGVQRSGATATPPSRSP
jgi:hypothetical protein